MSTDVGSLTTRRSRSPTRAQWPPGLGPFSSPDAAVVEGYSNPAWLAVLIAGRLLGLFDRGAWFGVPDYVAYPKAVALLCCAGVFAACYCRWSGRVDPA